MSVLKHPSQSVSPAPAAMPTVNLNIGRVELPASCRGQEQAFQGALQRALSSQVGESASPIDRAAAQVANTILSRLPAGSIQG